MRGRRSRWGVGKVQSGLGSRLKGLTAGELGGTSESKQIVEHQRVMTSRDFRRGGACFFPRIWLARMAEIRYDAGVEGGKLIPSRR